MFIFLVNMSMNTITKLISCGAYVYKVRTIWIFDVCNVVGGRLFVKFFRYIWLRIFWKHLILLRLGSPRLLCLGEKKRDGDGWKAKCHNSLSSSLSYITQTFSDCIKEKTIHDPRTNVVLVGLDKMEDFEENIL